MKKFLFLVVFGLISSQVHALSGISKGGHTACLKKEWLNDIISFAAAKDRDNFQIYLDTKKCLVLRKELQVTVTETFGFGTIVEFVFQGFKFYTVREAFAYDY